MTDQPRKSGGDDEGLPQTPPTVDWSMERTRLAKERTFAAWIRTALSTIAVGVAMVKLLSSEPQWIVRTLGLLFVVMGGAVAVLGFKTYRDIFRKMENEGFQALPSWVFSGLMLCFTLCLILCLVLILS